MTFNWISLFLVWVFPWMVFIAFSSADDYKSWTKRNLVTMGLFSIVLTGVYGGLHYYIVLRAYDMEGWLTIERLLISYVIPLLGALLSSLPIVKYRIGRER